MIVFDDMMIVSVLRFAEPDHKGGGIMIFTCKIAVVHPIILTIHGHPLIIGANAGGVVIKNRSIGQSTVIGSHTISTEFDHRISGGVAIGKIQSIDLKIGT